MQSEQGRSRSLAVALHAKQRLQGQQQCSPHLEQHQQGQPAKRPLTSALTLQQRQQRPMSGHATGDTMKARPMTVCSVLQAKLGSPPSILQRPSSAHTRSEFKLTCLQLCIGNLLDVWMYQQRCQDLVIVASDTGSLSQLCLTFSAGKWYEFCLCCIHIS